MEATERIEPVNRLLDTLLRQAAPVTSGNVADYIPELAKADPEAFGIAVVSVLGHPYEAGLSRTEFTLQSISKPFVYALALGQLGLEKVHASVGFEPSGEPFNAFSLDEHGRPANPMVNAGALLTSSLIPGPSPDERFAHILRELSLFAGRQLAVDEAVFTSEMQTGDRNRALAYLMRASGSLAREVPDVTEVYFRQCSVLVNSYDVAVMSATLANDGVNPMTGIRVVDPVVARHTLAVMGSCGMYDYAGQWAVRVGMPAKSGVSGGISAVKPGQFGIGVFSPRLDEAGNSSRGVAVLTMLSQQYGLSLLEHPARPASPIHRLEWADQVLVVGIRGDLDFVDLELVVHEVAEELAARQQPGSEVRFDLTHVTSVGDAAQMMLKQLISRLQGSGFQVSVVDPSGIALPATEREQHGE